SPLASTGNGATRAQSGAASSSAQAADAGSTGGDTTVNLSGLSGQLRSQSASGSADIDTALVQSIKDALNDGTLTIDYTGVTDAPTPLNLTNHSYFNLSGRAGSDVRGHLLQIDADAFVEVDDALIPTGTADVTGSAFDFRQSAPIGARLDWPHAQLARGRGFDHCYVLRDPGRGVRPVAAIYDPESG
ncbi:flagellar biosynthesis anti-sigma factor FlgM, partial [Paraburkholderia sp. SIMBA_049]